jgi:hypothetical protein|tara:strand:+ start:280 stop:453 length:174 start_codon:yes stop_codon:yes gene_type:complete
MKKKYQSRESIPDGNYVLQSINIKELMDKYPDKVVDVVDRERDIVVIMDTCRIVIKK